MKARDSHTKGGGAQQGAASAGMAVRETHLH